MQLNLTVVNNERVSAAELKFIGALQEKSVPTPLPNATFSQEMDSFFTVAIEQAQLTPEEAYSLYAFELARWNNMVETIVHREELLAVDREQFDVVVRMLLSSPSFRFWYQTFKPTLNQNPVPYLDKLSSEIGSGQASSATPNATRRG